jgi:hypothetical protein
MEKTENYVVHNGIEIPETVFDVPDDTSVVYYRGKSYSSLHSLATLAGIDYSTLRGHKSKGLQLEEVVDSMIINAYLVKNFSGWNAVTYKGKVYPSLTNLALTLNISRSSLKKKDGIGVKFERSSK